MGFGCSADGHNDSPIIKFKNRKESIPLRYDLCVNKLVDIRIVDVKTFHLILHLRRNAIGYNIFLPDLRLEAAAKVELTDLNVLLSIYFI